MDWSELRTIKTKKQIVKDFVFSKGIDKIALEKKRRDEEAGSKQERKYRRELLGKLSNDLDYLETLASEVDLSREAKSEVKREAEDAINFLKNRQEFWSQFKPMYAEKRN